MNIVRRLSIAVVSTIVATALFAAPQAKLAIGGQNGASNYYDGSHRYFTDYAKYLGQWWWPNQDGSAKIEQQDQKAFLAAEKANLLDSNGYPLELPLTVPGFSSQMYVESVLPGFFPAGDYVLLYDGVGTIDFYRSNYITISSQAPNRIALRCTPKAEGAFYAVLMIKTSQRGNHVRNIRILPASLETTYNPSQPFAKSWLDVVNHLSVYRFMGHCGMNDWVTHAKWKNRVTRGYYSQSTARGISYELGVQMCNLLKVDPWFCIPHMVDDEYIRSFAQMVKQNLDPALKVYIEYSNEIWNWAYPYPQAQYVIQCGRMAGMPEWDAADTVYNALKKLKDASYAHPEMDAYMIQRVLNIWRSVFTGADRSRLVCVAAGQIGWADNSNRILKYLYNTGGEFTSFGSTGGGCDALAGAPYFSRTETMADWEEGPLVHARLARERGIRNIYYEGGSEANQGRVGSATGPFWNATVGVYDKYDSILTRMQMSDIAADLFVMLTVVGNIDGYAHLDSLTQIDLPASQQPWKWQAIMAHTTRVPVSYEVAARPHATAGTARVPARSAPTSRVVLPTARGPVQPGYSLTGQRCSNKPGQAGLRIVPGVYMAK